MTCLPLTNNRPCVQPCGAVNEVLRAFDVSDAFDGGPKATISTSFHRGSEIIARRIFDRLLDGPAPLSLVSAEAA
jgi:hypothetical protein